MFEAGELTNREGGDGDPFGSPVFDGIAESVASVAALRTLVGVDVLSLSDDECLGVLDDLERARRAVEAVRMAVAVDVERRGCTQTRFGNRTGGFLAKRHGLPGGDSHGLVKTGQKLLLTLPDIGAALRAGTISAAQAQAIASATTYRNEAGMRAAQDALIGLAAGSQSFKQFKLDVDGIARLADPDGGHDPRPDRNRLSRKWVNDELHLQGTLVGELAKEFDQILDVEASRLWRRYRNDHKACDDIAVPGRKQLAAEALVDLLRRGFASDYEGDAGAGGGHHVGDP